MDGDRVFVTEAGDDQRDITITKENGVGGVDYRADDILDPKETVTEKLPIE